MEEEEIGLKRLLMAMIIQALKDTVSTDPEVRKDAEDWFSKRSFRPFGFLYCLEFSGLSEAIIEHLFRDRGLIKNLKSIMQVKRTLI